MCLLIADWELYESTDLTYLVHHFIPDKKNNLWHIVDTQQRHILINKWTNSCWIIFDSIKYVHLAKVFKKF